MKWKRDLCALRKKRNTVKAEETEESVKYTMEPGRGVARKAHKIAPQRSSHRRRRKLDENIHLLVLFGTTLSLVCSAVFVQAVNIDESLASFDPNFEFGANLEKRVAAVFIKVAHGSTTTTKRSIPDSVAPAIVTTIPSPLLTTINVPAVSVSTPNVGQKMPKGLLNNNSGTLHLGKKLNENVDELLEIASKPDDASVDPRKKHYELLDIDRAERVLPTLPSNSDILKTSHNSNFPPGNGASGGNSGPRHHHNHQNLNRNYANSTPMPSYSVNGHNNKNNLPPSYSPPSRSFFTPPLPPEYQNPFADKPTLRGTQSENSLLLLQQGQSPPALDFNHHTGPSRRLPPVPLPHEKKVLNTPSSSGGGLGQLPGGQTQQVLINQLNHFLLSTTAHPNIQNHSQQQHQQQQQQVSSASNSNSVLHIPSISRILSGSNGRKEDFPEVLLRKATVKPSVGKMHTTTVKISRNTTSTTLNGSTNAMSSASSSTTTAKSVNGGGIEDNTEEIELDEQLNKNLLVLVNKNEEEDRAAGEEDGTGRVMMEPTDMDGKSRFDKNFMASEGGDNLWSILWNFHIYLTAILFTIISVYSIFKIIFYDKLIYLFSQKFFLMIYCLIITISLIRIYYLCYDPYNINASFDYLLNDFFLNFPQFLMTVLLVLLIYYLIVKIYFNDLLLLVSGSDWDEALMDNCSDDDDDNELASSKEQRRVEDGGGAVAGEEERIVGGEETNPDGMPGDNCKRITLDKKNKIILVEAKNNNNSNILGNENEEAGNLSPAHSPDSNGDNNFYLNRDFKVKEKNEKNSREHGAVEYHGWFLVYFLKNFYKKNAKFFNIVLGINVALMLAFITLFIVFYLRLRLAFNANLWLVFVKCFVQFLNLNLILVYFYIYKKLKQLLVRFKLKIVNLINCNNQAVIMSNTPNTMASRGVGGLHMNNVVNSAGVGGGDKSNNSNKILLSDSNEGNNMTSTASGTCSSDNGSHANTEGHSAFPGTGVGGTVLTGDHQGSGRINMGTESTAMAGHVVNSNTNLVRTFQRSFNLKRINYLIFIKNLFNAINITIGIIMLYLLFIIINLLYFVYYYYYYYVNANGRDNQLEHNNLIFDKEKLNNIFLIKFNWLEWSYQFSNRLIELTILILFIWVLNIKFISNARRKKLFSGHGSGGKKHNQQRDDEMVDNETFIMNLNLNKHQVVSYNTNNNQVEFNAPMVMVGGQQQAMVGPSSPPEHEDILMDNEYENPINIYQQLANSSRDPSMTATAAAAAGRPYYGASKNYQGYYQEPVGSLVVTPGIPMMMNPSNTTIFNSVNVRNNEFRASKNLKQFKSTNSLATAANNSNNNNNNNINNGNMNNASNINNNINNPTVMNQYRQQQPLNYHHHHEPPPSHHHQNPYGVGGGGAGGGGGGGNNFYDVINPNSSSSQAGSNYYYSLRNPPQHHMNSQSSHSMAGGGLALDSDGQYRSGGSDVGGYDQRQQMMMESAYQSRSMKKPGQKHRTRKKKANPAHHRHHNTMGGGGGGVGGVRMMAGGEIGILPGVVVSTNGGVDEMDCNNFDDGAGGDDRIGDGGSGGGKRGNSNKMLVDDNGFVRFKEFEERNNDSGIIVGGCSGDYGEQLQQQQQHQADDGLMGFNSNTLNGKKKGASHFLGGMAPGQATVVAGQRQTPYHHHPHPSNSQYNQQSPGSQDFDDFFGGKNDNNMMI